MSAFIKSHFRAYKSIKFCVSKLNLSVWSIKTIDWIHCHWWIHCINTGHGKSARVRMGGTIEYGMKWFMRFYSKWYVNKWKMIIHHRCNRKFNQSRPYHTVWQTKMNTDLFNDFCGCDSATPSYVQYWFENSSHLFRITQHTASNKFITFLQ